MRLFLVRHVKAGDRSHWRGPDELRPASRNGRRQATALADRLEQADVSSVVSSPSVRCVQTVEPLADRLGLKVEIDHRLAEGSSIEQSLAVVAEAADGAVLCSHGDVIPDLIAALARRGTALTTEPDWRKATVWVLDGDRRRSPTGDVPQFRTAAVEPPPSI